MSKQTKIIIGVVAGVLVLCLAICVVGIIFVNMMGKNIVADAQPDPAKAAQTASEIADFTPLDGYQAITDMKILGYTVVVYSNGNSDSEVLILMEMAMLTEINESTIKQMQQAVERQSGQSSNNMRVVESRDLTIRDKPARMIVQEGTSSETSVALRQLMVAFQGKGGVCMLMLTVPADQWDQESIDRMVESIH
jgi:hypothetical protein